MNKLIRMIVCLGVLFALAVTVVSADTPTPEPPHGKPTTPAGQTSPGKPAVPPGQQKKSTDESDKDEKIKQPHGVFGIVTTIASGTFTIATKKGESVVVQVSNNTRFHIPTLKVATFADLKLDDRVAVSGTSTVSGLDAKKVSIAPGKPSVQHRVGTVEAYVAGKSITIKTVQREIEKFVVANDTQLRGKSSIEKGDRVTIVSRRDPSTREFKAQAIVVHP